MKRLKYVCDDCEDNEYYDELLKDGHYHCECGGHLFLVKADNFSKIKDYSDCLICANNGSEECYDCNRRMAA